MMLRNFSVNHLSKSIPALNLSELIANDIVVLAQQPLMSNEEVKVEIDESHQTLIQQIAKTNPQMGSVILAKVEISAEGSVDFQVSPIAMQALNSYQVMTGGALTFYVYYLGNISRALHIYDALHTSFLNIE